MLLLRFIQLGLREGDKEYSRAKFRAKGIREARNEEKTLQHRRKGEINGYIELGLTPSGLLVLILRI